MTNFCSCMTLSLHFEFRGTTSDKRFPFQNQIPRNVGGFQSGRNSGFYVTFL